MQRIFDPCEGSGSMLVATFDGQTPTMQTALDYERARSDWEREKELRSIGRVMAERSSVCG